ncbi:hypothetical protein V1478_001616 [Vespula squamosa]|uniref:Uncharacterized protein n=1 Tax=Vespula squamosa TaxID=30214 RepID=A0ABD2C207_VESSQ
MNYALIIERFFKLLK